MTRHGSTAVGSLVERTDADELITVTYAYDPAVRNKSLELLADVWFRPPEAR
ncbi:hypothetical protein [Rhodococcus sp. IEGM 1408]|uniref:hypothetical protein n=1 Tax=Rhodococcus sp. IEGM 1408 TaxID=3082220 RepID=UPI002952F90E|nr:hypothetical protein [Rhodococcus sp. IEGM 1408]MDV8002192.1 hypothetical protein [Rhodococcus sp. IEGM 1408]